MTPESEREERRLRGLRLLRDDLRVFSGQCLKVKPKTGSQLVPFVWNAAQVFVHEKLEAQRKEMGFVRALILKGRQQGCCFAPHHKVLMADLTWRAIGDIEPGERVVAVDENVGDAGLTAVGRALCRRFRTADVEAVARLRKPVLRVTMASGRELVVTGEHRMLFRKRGADDAVWRTIADARAGDHIRSAFRAPVCDPPGFEDGWFAGILDGEGHRSSKAETSVSVSVSQVSGPVLDRARAYLDRLGLRYTETVDSRRPLGRSKLGSKDVHRLEVSRIADVVHLMDRCRTSRIRFDSSDLEGRKIGGNKADAADSKQPSWDAIVSIEHAGEIDVVDLQTSVKTYIVEGLVSHNSTYVAARFYHRCSMNAATSAFIMSHEQKSTSNLYGMVRRYHDHNPLPVSTGATNAQELIFDRLDSGYKLATAGTKDVGRGNTAQLLHGCLSPDTLIIDPSTSRLRRMGDFRVGDMVRTHRGNVAPVTFISSQRKAAREVVLRTVNSFPLVATDDHKFWSRDGMKRLGDMRPGDEIGFPIAEIEDREVVLDFAQPARPRPQGGGSIERVADRVTLNYDVGRVLGLYLAEGVIKCQHKDGEPSGVHFCVHEREVDRTIHWLGLMAGLIASIRVRARRGSKAALVEATGRSFAHFVAAMCGRVDDKVVPDVWRRAGPDFARGLLHGYLSGDGHFDADERRIVATSVRASITVAMRDIAAALGYGWASIALKPGAVRHGRNERDAYIMSICGEGAMRLAQECGKPLKPRQRAAGGGNFGAVIEGGYAWLKIASIGELVEREVMDFEVGHEDHSYCTIQCAASNSEVGFWSNAEQHMASIGNTIADEPGTEIILESTANGLGNYFHQAWQRAEAGEGLYIPIFIPWYWQKEYRAKVRPGLSLSPEDEEVMLAYNLDLEQMQWRADKIASYGSGFDWLFKQEYPNTPIEGFQTGTTNPLVSPTHVTAAATGSFYDEHGPLILGCDPAGDGDGTADRTAIVLRRGRVVLRVEYHDKLNTMQVAGKLADLARAESPDHIVVDKGGLGAGVIDRLRELGFVVVAVNFGGQADDPHLYANKKAEMWWRMRDWFADQPTRIPNDPALIADVCAPMPGPSTSNGLKQLESKDSLKRRGIRSPDGGDALALTFAYAFQQKVGDDLRSTRHLGPADRVGY